MEKEYRLSAGAITQTVMSLRKSGIYGVKNVLSKLSGEELAALQQESARELEEKGLGALDADGVFQPDKDFSEVIRTCADGIRVLCADKRTDWGKAKIMCYLLGDSSTVLELVGENEYILRVEEEPVAQILRFLDLQDGNGTLTEAAFDSDLIINQDAEGLAQVGCSPDTVKLIINAARDEEGYSRVTYVEDHTIENDLTLLHGPEGTLVMSIEYNDIQELFRVTPISNEEASARIKTMTEVQTHEHAHEHEH